MGSSAVELHTQVPPDWERMIALTEMMYTIVDHVVIPARISVVNREPTRVSLCPDPSNLNHLPKAESATRSFNLTTNVVMVVPKGVRLQGQANVAGRVEASPN
jgi:hypothetical protein